MSTPRRPRVLIIDDSAFARTVLARLMRASGKIDIVGTTRDGRDGLNQIASLDPDVVTLDLTMPTVDGLAVLRALAGRSRPRVIVVSISTIDTEIGAEALSLGAIDLVAKPTALPTDRLHEIGDELVAKVLAAAAGYLVPVPVRKHGIHRGVSGRFDLVMIGTSTGGPQALTRIVAGLPATLAAPVAIVLHIPAGYTEALARRLDNGSPLDVREAQDGMVLYPGLAILARGGMHLRVEGQGTKLVARIGVLPVQPFTPSVDELFLSGAAATQGSTLGVVLTGMGDDGLIGARAIAAAGGTLLTESPSTCVVYGMPRSVDEAELGAVSYPLDEMAAEIASRV